MLGTCASSQFPSSEYQRFNLAEHQGMPRPGLRPFEDGRPPYGRGEPGFGLRPPPAAWMAGFGMGAPAGWRGPQRFRNGNHQIHIPTLHSTALVTIQLTIQGVLLHR